MRKIARPALILALLVVATACRPADISGAVASGELIAFPGLDSMAETFNADRGVPRLILSLSPT